MGKMQTYRLHQHQIVVDLYSTHELELICLSFQGKMFFKKCMCCGVLVIYLCSSDDSW